MAATLSPFRDAPNRLLYGAEAPVLLERLWLPISAITEDTLTWGQRSAQRTNSARVLRHWPARESLAPTLNMKSVRLGLAHWRDGVPWEATGIYEEMMRRIEQRGKVDGCRNLDDVHARYLRLDQAFAQMREDGRMKTRAELKREGSITFAFRESGGIVFHFGPQGEPFFGGWGCHRLAMAIALGLSYIPIRVGYVHASALNAVAALRAEPVGIVRCVNKS